MDNETNCKSLLIAFIKWFLRQTQSQSQTGVSAWTPKKYPMGSEKAIFRSIFRILLDDPDLWPIIVEPCVNCHLAGFFR